MGARSLPETGQRLYVILRYVVVNYRDIITMTLEELCNIGGCIEQGGAPV